MISTFLCMLVCCGLVSIIRVAGNPLSFENHLQESTQLKIRTHSSNTDFDLDKDITGRYAHYDIVTYSTKMNRFYTMVTEIISYGFTDLSWNENKTEIIAHESFCHAEQLSNNPVTSVVPDEFTRAIQPKSTLVTRKPDAQGRYTLNRPKTPFPLGVHLKDNTKDEFPTDPSDPRIFDADNDGKPGVTVKLKFYFLSMELYIIRRERFEYNVTLMDDNRLVGLVTDTSQQLILGSNVKFLTPSQTEWVQDPDLSKSPIILVPVDRSYDCDRLMKERDSLFPPNPKP